MRQKLTTAARLEVSISQGSKLAVRPVLTQWRNQICCGSFTCICNISNAVAGVLRATLGVIWLQLMFGKVASNNLGGCWAHAEILSWLLNVFQN
jgi:hypothetical protein